MAQHRLYILIAALILSFGCQKPESKDQNNSPPQVLPEKPQYGPATGWINGQAWSLQSGRARFHQHGLKEYLVIELWNEAIREPCKERGSDLRVQIQALPEEGIWEIGPDSFKSHPVIRFIDTRQPQLQSSRIIANEGFVEILLSEAYVGGSFRGLFTNTTLPHNEVLGSFEVPLCQ